MAGVLRCREDVGTGTGVGVEVAVEVAVGKPVLGVGMVVRLVLDGVRLGTLVADEFETEKLATVEVEVGGGVEAEKAVV
jgi:hypothetical protein